MPGQKQRHNNISSFKEGGMKENQDVTTPRDNDNHSEMQGKPEATIS
jgi:hypothetical protein